MRPPQTDGTRHFVGREEPRARLWKTLQHSGCVWLDDVEGVRGIGKTSFLAKMFEELDADAHLRPVWVDLAQYQPGDAVTTQADDWVAAFVEYHALLKDISRQLPTELFVDFGADEAFDDALEAAAPYVSNVHAEGGSAHVDKQAAVARDVKGGDATITVNPLPEHLRAALDKTLHQITDDFAERVSRLAPDCRVVLFLDNFSHVLGGRLGDLVIDVILELDDVVAVLARTESGRSLPDTCRDQSTRLAMPCFDRLAVAAYLIERFPALTEQTREVLADRIFTISCGHPLLVGLAGDVVDVLGSGPDEVMAVFDRESRSLEDEKRHLVQAIESAIADDDILHALEVLSVVRSFDSDLLASMMQPDVPAAEPCAVDYVAITKRISQFSFVQFRDGNYKISEFLRELKRSTFTARRKAELHDRARSYYEHLLELDAETRRELAPYRRQFRNEDPAWQEAIVEWLFHLLSSRDDRLALQRLTAVFLDAYWWWGAYIDSPFCKTLLEQALRLRPTGDLGHGLRELWRFYAEYPVETHAEQCPGGWKAVEGAITYLQSLLRIDEQTSDPERLRIRGLTSAFLAIAWQQLYPSEGEAFVLLGEARRAFEAMPDEEGSWELPWVDSHEAEFCLREGRWNDAIAAATRCYLAASSPSIPDVDRDCEVIATAHRIAADAWSGLGEPLVALRQLLWAVLFSYRFHATDQPDRYTQAFHAQMLQNVAERLRELRASGEESILQKACDEAHDLWRPYWRGRGVGGAPVVDTNSTVESLVVQLYPPPPADTELGEDGAEYVEEVRSVTRHIKDYLAPNGIDLSNPSTVLEDVSR